MFNTMPMKPENLEPEPPTHLEELVDQVKDYIDTRSELIILKTTQKVSSASGIAVSYLICIFLSVMVLVLLSIGAALWIGKALGDSFSGFFLIAGFYIVLLLIFYLGRTNLVKKPVANKIIDEILND